MRGGRDGGGEGRERLEQVVQDLVSHREDLGFDAEGSGSAGGLWEQEGDLTQGLAGALW